MVLETERVMLVPWQPEDWLAFRAIATDSEVMRYISDGQPWADERIQQFVNDQIETFGTRQFCMWKLILKKTGALVGFCGLQPLRDTAEIEIGWWLGHECWGKGLATEAAREALRDAFERVRLRRVVAVAQPANRASLRVMQKLGMNYEGTMLHKGVSVVLYSIASSQEPTVAHDPK